MSASKSQKLTNARNKKETISTQGIDTNRNAN